MRTVANLITAVIKAQQACPDDTDSPHAKACLEELTKAEAVLSDAIAYYGPVVHAGYAYLGTTPVRTGRYVRVSLMPANVLPWPPVAPVSEERLAGSLPQVKF